MKFKTGGSKSEGSKHYIRLKDGDSVSGVLRGDPVEYRTHWVGQGTVLCTRKNRTDTACKYCNEGNKPAFRFKLNMIIKENGALTAKILESGWTVYESLDALNKEYPLDKTTIKISRKGSGKNDTTYSVIPVRGGEVNADLEKMIGAVKLHDLNGKETPPTQEEPPYPEEWDQIDE